MRKIFLSVLSGIIASACSVSETIDPMYLPDLQKRSGELKATALWELKEFGTHAPAGFVKQQERIVVGRSAGGFHAFSFNLKTREKQSLFTRGRGKDQIAFSHSLSPSGTTGVSMLDIQRGMLFSAQTDVATKAGASKELPVQLPAEQQHLVAARAGEMVISTGLYEQGRYFLFSSLENQGDYFLDYPAHPAFPVISEQTKSMLYASSVLKVRPDNQAFVCGDMYSGILDICRIRNGNIERIRQHVFHYPKVYIRTQISGTANVAYSKDNCFGFTDVSVSNDRIYAIYSGKTYRQNSRDFQQSQTLIVLDWEGNILNTYGVDTPLSHIQYEADENAVYAVGYTPKTTLVKIDL